MVIAKEQPYYFSLPKKRRKIRHKKRVHPLPRHEKLALTGLVMLVFGAGILVVFFCAQIVSAGYQINIIKKEVNNLNIDTQNLNEGLSKLASLERVEKIATGKLGMVRPETSEMLLVKTDSPATEPGLAKKQEYYSLPAASGLKEGGNWIFNALMQLVGGRGGLEAAKNISQPSVAGHYDKT